MTNGRCLIEQLLRTGSRSPERIQVVQVEARVRTHVEDAMEQVRNTRQVRSKANAAAVDLASPIQAAAKILLGEGHAQSPLLADVDTRRPADRL